jgi:hypothetical protein
VTTSSASCSFFSLFGALMPKGERNVYLSFSSSFLFGFGLQDFNLVRVGRVGMCFKTLWYAYKDI